MGQYLGVFFCAFVSNQFVRPSPVRALPPRPQLIKGRLQLLAIFGAAMLASVTSSEPAWAQKRVALVFGNSAYQNAPKLPNPTKDASSIAQMFKDAGFDSVDLQLDLGTLDFKRAVRKFEAAAEQADVAVIYFAGHAIEIGGTNYLIPVDARLASDRDAEDEAVSLERLVSSAEGAQRLRLIILDACRDNPFVGTMKRERKAVNRSISTGLGLVAPTSIDTLIAYAARAGSVAEDGDGAHSPFAEAILKDLPVPGLDVRLAFGRVRDDVLRATQNRQEPFVYGSLGGGNIALVPAPAVPTAQEASGAGIKADYELVQKIGTKRAWEVFLGTHPTGFYADLAHAQIEAMERQRIAALPPQQPSPAPPTKDAQEWDKVKDSGDAAALQKFFQRFSASPFASDARQRIDALKTAARERDEATAKARADALATEKAGRAALPNSPELVHAAQAELIRLGCFNGEPDDKLASTRTALRRYLTIEGLPANPIVTQDLVTELTKHTTRICPLECKSGEILKGEACVAEKTPTEPSPRKDGAEQRQQARREKPAQEKPRQQAQARPSVVSGGSKMGGMATGVGF
jgi:Caspase domain